MGEESAEAIMAEYLRAPARDKTLAIKAYKARLRKRQRRMSQRDNDFKIDSSWIHELTYHPEMRKVWVLFNDKKYTFFDIPPSVFKAWEKGAATCVTDDTSKQQRWNIGDTPSLGAFFNRNIWKHGTKKVLANGKVKVTKGHSRYDWKEGWV